MKALILLIAALIQNVTPFNSAENQGSTFSCEVGDTIQNGRVTCTCTQEHIYECVLKKSSKIDVHKHLHKSLSCQPNKMYVEESTTCICNHNGTWPNSACGDVFDSLPAEYVVKTRCEPDGYVFVGCNVCRCDSKGFIDKTRCTNNECHQSNHTPDKRRSLKTNAEKNVYGNCEARNWYSLAPCQFCYCLNENKLVCNTGNYNSKQLQLGSYNLNVCGKDLIREAIELIPGNEKSLRQGEEKSTVTSTTTKPSTIPQPFGLNKDDNIQIRIEVSNEAKSSQENDLSEKNEKFQEKRDEESSSESSEKRDFAFNNREESNIGSTKLPFQDDYQLTDTESKDLTPAKKDDEEEDRNTDNEIVERGLKIPINLAADSEHTTPDNEMEKQTLKNWEDLGAQLKATLPMVLDKVFRMALRKSMVTVVNDNQCVPGSVQIVKCNTCFCLKNSKLVCTDNKCPKEANK